MKTIAGHKADKNGSNSHTRYPILTDCLVPCATTQSRPLVEGNCLSFGGRVAGHVPWTDCTANEPLNVLRRLYPTQALCDALLLANRVSG